MSSTVQKIIKWSCTTFLVTVGASLFVSVVSASESVSEAAGQSLRSKTCSTIVGPSGGISNGLGDDVSIGPVVDDLTAEFYRSYDTSHAEPRSKICTTLTGSSQNGPLVIPQDSVPGFQQVTTKGCDGGTQSGNQCKGRPRDC